MKKDKKPAAPTGINPEADAAAPHSVQDLKEISALAEKILVLEQRMERGVELLRQLQSELDTLQTVSLPERMAACGMESFTLSNGYKVIIDQIVSAKIPSQGAIDKERDPERRKLMQLKINMALSYLRKNNAEALIKQVLFADIGKDGGAKASQALAALKKLGIIASTKETVHPQTLSSWVRERITNGSPVDFELLSVYSGPKAKITGAPRKQPPAPQG